MILAISQRDPITCTLYGARVNCVQEYSYDQQQCLKEGLLEDHPACAFVKMLIHVPPEQYIIIM